MSAARAHSPNAVPRCAVFSTVVSTVFGGVFGTVFSTVFATTLVGMFVVSVVGATTAHAQTHCYKGACDGLLENAQGSNFGALEITRMDDGLQVDGTSGGPVDATYLGATDQGPCVGYATALPDHILELPRGAGRARLDVAARADTALLVYGPSGWQCNDDTNGLQPSLTLDLSAGTYRVWVSSYDAGYHDYTLTIRTAARAPSPEPPHEPALVFDIQSSRAEHGAAVLNARQVIDGRTYDGMTGGRVDPDGMLDSEGIPCWGYTGTTPDHIITFNERVDSGEFRVESPADTTLIVHGPQGFLCNDDAYDFDPAIDGSFPAGTYRIWIGTFEPVGPTGYALSITDGSQVDVFVDEPVRWSFRGAFEDTDVFFEADTASGIFDDCVPVARSMNRSGWVDDIVVWGGSYRLQMGYWEPDALCSIAALNARPSTGTPAALSGSIEGAVPFEMCGDPVAMQGLIRTHLPRAIGDMSVDDITINGTPSHNQSSWWSADQVVSMVMGHVPSGQVFGGMTATGDIEGTPFSFTGATAADIRQQCEAFIATTVDDWIDDINVNGQVRHNQTGWWEAPEACAIISALAR